jgi:hypothetical protein
MATRNKLTNQRDIYPQDPQPAVGYPQGANRTAGKRTEKRYADGLGWSSKWPGHAGTNKSDPQEPVSIETVDDAKRLHADPSLARPEDGWPVILSSRRGVQTFTEQQVLMTGGGGVDASDWPDITIIDQDVANAPEPAGVNEATDCAFDRSRTHTRAYRNATSKLARGFGFGGGW